MIPLFRVTQSMSTDSACRNRMRLAVGTAHRSMYRMLRLVVLACLLSQCFIALPQTAHAQGNGGHGPRALPELLRQASAAPGQAFRVIVVRRDRRADDYVVAHGGKKLVDVGNVGFVAVVKGKDLANLASQVDVNYVTMDAPLQLASTDSGASVVSSANLATLYPQASDVTTAWSNSLTGYGVGVAVLDTGIASVPDFQASSASWTSRILQSVQFSTGITSLTDLNGHGTHVAGIIAGNSWLGSNSAVRGKYVGMAPQANLLNVKVANDQGESYTSDLINAMDWVIQNRQTYNIRVMNLSLQSSVAESYLTSPLDAEVEKAWFNGILVVTAAGNNGANSELYPPGNDPFVVTVGAVDANNTASPSDDFLAPWSSYGATQDGYSKPDVVAVGRQVYAPLASLTSVLATDFPDRILNGSYIWLSGTSMSSAVVSGAAAVIFQAHPEWTNDQVKWLLTHTAVQLGTHEASTGAFTAYAGQGAGEIDVDAVLHYNGTIGSANQGQTISSLLTGPNDASVYNNSAAGSASSWSTSSWSTSSWSTSSWSTSSWSTSSWSTSTTSN